MSLMPGGGSTNDVSPRGIDVLFDTLRASLARYLATGDPRAAEEGSRILIQLQAQFDRSVNNVVCGDGQAHQVLLCQLLMALTDMAIAPSYTQAQDVARQLERLSHIPESVLGKDLQRTAIVLTETWRTRERRAAAVMQDRSAERD